MRRLDDFDTWWHWPGPLDRSTRRCRTDVLSFTVPQNEWINLQWLYDLLLYGLAGGASLLVLASPVFRRHVRDPGPPPRPLRRRRDDHAAAVWVAMTVNERFLIRPEMASFRCWPPCAGAHRRPAATPQLRWLVPLMLLWATRTRCSSGPRRHRARSPRLVVGSAASRRLAPRAACRRASTAGGGAALAALVNSVPRALLFP
jgi:hypothetical protein